MQLLNILFIQLQPVLRTTFHSFFIQSLSVRYCPLDYHSLYNILSPFKKNMYTYFLVNFVLLPTVKEKKGFEVFILIFHFTCTIFPK